MNRLSNTMCHIDDSWAIGNGRYAGIAPRNQSALSTADCAPWVWVDPIAGHLGVTRDPIDRWIERKHLPAHRVGRLWKFKVTEVDDWVRAGGADEEKKPD